MRQYSLISLCLLPFALAADITGQVLLDAFPGNVLPVGSKVVLDYGARSASILYDGTFSLSDVPEGEHILDTLVPGYSLPTTLYNINSTSIHAQPYITSRLPLPLSTPSLPLPLTLIPAKDEYYTSPPGVNILGMLKNPMILMMLFSGVMMFFMPKIMASMEMDPEMAKEMADTQKKMQGMQNMDFMGSILSGEQSGAATPTLSAGGGGGSGNGNGNSGKKGKRR